jgi:hypothetical protein
MWELAKDVLIFICGVAVGFIAFTLKYRKLISVAYG